MQFEKGIWHAAWDVYRANWKTVAAAILAATVLDLVTQYRGKSGSTIVMDLLIWNMMAISAHGTVLLGNTDYAFSRVKHLFWRFIWRSFVLMFLSLIPFLIAWFLIHGTGSTYTSGLKALPVLALATLVIFALLGTWLPAVVANGDRRIGPAIDRAERTFFYSAGRLLLGPGLVQIAFVPVPLVAYMSGILTGEVFGAAGFSVLDLIWLPINYAAHAYSVALVAVILSRAYLKAESATMAPAAQTS